MNLKNLTDGALLSQILHAIKTEKEATLQVIHHLREVERRMLYARQHSSLFDYCIEELGYDAGAAHLRISSMRLLNELPELEEKVTSGELNLSLMTQVRTFFKKEGVSSIQEKREVIELISGKSKREAHKILMGRSKAPEVHYPDSVRPLSKTHSEVRFVADEVLLQELEELRASLAHSHPGAGLKDLIQHAVRHTLKDRRAAFPDKVTERQTSQAAVKRQVWKRDGGRCAYRDEKGKTCDSTYALEFDHKTPRALGGLSSRPGKTLVLSGDLKLQTT